MNIFSVVKGLFTALFALPQLIGLILEVRNGIRKLKRDADREKALQEFKEAINQVKKTGDTSQLERLYANYVQSH